MSGDTLSGNLALDTSVIIEMLLSTDLGRMVTEALIADSADAHSSELNLAEAEYILCRKLGRDTAKSKLDGLRGSNYVHITETDQVSRIAAQIKCERALAFGDCFTLATAKATSSLALFAFREEDLLHEMRRKPYDVPLSFLQDLTRNDDA